MFSTGSRTIDASDQIDLSALRLSGTDAPVEEPKTAPPERESPGITPFEPAPDHGRPIEPQRIEPDRKFDTC